MPEEAEAHVIHVGFYLNDMIFDCCKTYVLKMYHKIGLFCHYGLY
jgi:hypothetical protein